MRSNPLHVCHLVSGDLWAGAEAMVWNLLRQLERYPDLKITTVILNRGRLAQRLIESGISTRIFEETRVSFPALVGKVAGYLRREKPAILHSHRYKENILAVFATLFGRRVGLVSTQHGMPESGPNGRGLRSTIVSRSNRYLLTHRFDSLVGVSANIGNFFVTDCRARPKKVRIIHNGIDMPESPRSRPRSAPVMGSAGRFTSVKDYPLFVAVAEIVNASMPSARFALAGDGPQRFRLEEMVKSAGLQPRFAFTGEVADMPSFFRGIDLYLNTSVHEGIPLSVLEAMAHGLPVVAPAVGGFPEIIDDGVEGFLVHSRNPRHFAEACLRLMQKRTLRIRMGTAARKRVARQFSAETMARQYHRLYMQIALHTAANGGGS